MKLWLTLLAGLLCTGCGAAISFTYTPPITFGVTLDMRTVMVQTAPGVKP